MSIGSNPIGFDESEVSSGKFQHMNNFDEIGDELSAKNSIGLIAGNFNLHFSNKSVCRLSYPKCYKVTLF